MAEIRIGDVLRLFFKKICKHYLVTKVGKNTIKLKNEMGAVVALQHSDGKLGKLGDAAITGFEILKDPARYHEFKVGVDLEVHFKNGEVFKGAIVDNEDGLLKLKNELGELKYADLDGDLKVKIVNSVAEFDPAITFLPDTVEDLFFLSIDNKRVYEAHRTTSEQYWPTVVMPVLDRSKIRLDNGEITFMSGKTFEKRTECVVFDLNLDGDNVLDRYVYVGLSGSKVAVQSYALTSPKMNMATFFQNFNGVNFALPTKEGVTFDTFQEAVAAYTPEIRKVRSAFDLALALFPLPFKEKYSDFILKKQDSKKTEPQSNKHAPLAKRTRYSLGAAYHGFIPEQLSTSETLARMLSLDSGQSYFTSKKIRQENDKTWALEKLAQKIKNNPSKHGAYAGEAVGVCNTLWSAWAASDFSTVLSVIQQYGRPPNPKEDQNSLYFSPPLFAKYKLAPLSVETRARAAVLKAVVHIRPVEVDRFLVDETSGVILEHLVEKPRVSMSLRSFENDLDRDFSEDDLIILNLARKLAKHINVLVGNEAKLLAYAKLNCDDAYKVACNVAAYIADKGGLSASAITPVLRAAVKRKWSAIHDSKTLTEDVSKAMKPKAKPTVKKHVRFVGKAGLKHRLVYPILQHTSRVEPVLKPLAVGAKMPTVQIQLVKEYENVADVFSPDLTAKAALHRCTPTVLEILAPNEKSFYRYLGGEKTNEKIYELVVNVSSFVPTLLASGAALFDRNICPKGCSKEFAGIWKAYYSPLLSVASGESEQIAAQFSAHYKKKNASFRRLAHLARQALCNSDEEMLEACAVRALFLHLESPISDEREAYTKKIIGACLHMHRFSKESYGFNSVGRKPV